MTFRVTSHGPNRLSLVEISRRCLDERRLADHFKDEQASDTGIDQFRRAVLVQVETLEVSQT
jgi:hypothetical protein